VEDVAKAGCWHVRNEGTDVGDAKLQGTRYEQRDGLSRLCATPARHTSRGAAAIVAPCLLVARARFRDDQAGDARSAEGQQGDDDAEGETPHSIILAVSEDS
jgi:hypothetical protein